MRCTLLLTGGPESELSLCPSGPHIDMDDESSLLADARESLGGGDRERLSDDDDAMVSALKSNTSPPAWSPYDGTEA